MALNYRLIKFSPLEVSRSTQGHYLNGRWIPGSDTIFTIKAKVQPLREKELLSLPESERNSAWLKVYVEEYMDQIFPELRTSQQGSGGWDSDTFTYRGYSYQIMKDKSYYDSCLDHTRVFAKRLEVTPN